LALQKECQILEGPLMPDHVHIRITIPPRHPDCLGNGVLEREERDCHRPHVRSERNISGEHFWETVGVAVSTLGFELEQVRKYIRDQEIADGNLGQSYYLQ